MHTARMADRLTLLTLGVTRASKQVLLEVLLNLLPPQREHIGVDQDLRSARDQGSLLDTEVYQLTHVFDTGRHCQLTLLDGPQLSDLYGSDLETAAVGSILQQVAQHGPVHGVLLVADGSMNVLSSSDNIILSLLLDMLSSQAAANTLAVFTNCGSRQWQGETPPGLHKRKLFSVPQTVFEVEPDRLELQPGEIVQLLHSWHDASAAVRQVLYAAAQQQPVDYQEIFKAHHKSSVGHPRSALEQYSAHQARQGSPAPGPTTPGTQPPAPDFASRPVRLAFESPLEQAGTSNPFQRLGSDDSTSTASTPQTTPKPPQAERPKPSKAPAGPAAPSPQSAIRQQAARMKAELRDGKSGRAASNPQAAKTPAPKGGHYVPTNSHTCHATLVVPASQTKQIGALFGSGGQVIDNIQSSSHSLITVPPRAQRQYGQPVNISISAARDSNIQDAIAQIKETIARG